MHKLGGLEANVVDRLFCSCVAGEVCGVCAEGVVVLVLSEVGDGVEALSEGIAWQICCQDI